MVDAKSCGLLWRRRLWLAGRQIRDQPAEKKCCRQRSGDLSEHEWRNIGGANARKRVGQRSSDRDGGIGKGRGCGKPVGRRDVGSDGKCDGVRAEPRTSPNDQEKPEGGDEFAEHLSMPAAGVARQRNDRQPEHEMRDDCSSYSSENLSENVERRFLPGNAFLQRI